MPRRTKDFWLPALTLAMAGIPIGHAQPARLSFDAVSVKPNKSGSEDFSLGRRGSTFSAINTTLRILIQTAYRPADDRALFDDQVAGGPGWMDTDRFDVVAKPPEGPFPSPAQISSMLQSLLEDRFRLQAHLETRNLPSYNLVVAKSGLKMKLSPDQTPAVGLIRFDASDDPLPRGALRVSVTQSVVVIAGNAVPLSRWMSIVEGRVGRKLIDKTGLKGLFDFSVRLSATETAADQTEPSIFAAIQELGFNLESAKEPMRVVVIDSVQKPSEN